MADVAVANASPIIVLARSGRIELLRATAGQIVVPTTVFGEIRRRGSADPAVIALAALPWLEIVDAGPVAAPVRACDLDAGESAVLTWALAHRGAEAILDDRPARRCAEALAIPHRGTLGVIVAARRAGLIPSARPVIDEVRRAGLYVGDALIRVVLEDLGE